MKKTESNIKTAVISDKPEDQKNSKVVVAINEGRGKETEGVNSANLVKALISTTQPSASPVEPKITSKSAEQSEKSEVEKYAKKDSEERKRIIDSIKGLSRDFLSYRERVASDDKALTFIGGAYGAAVSEIMEKTSSIKESPIINKNNRKPANGRDEKGRFLPSGKSQSPRKAKISEKNIKNIKMSKRDKEIAHKMVAPIDNNKPLKGKEKKLKKRSYQADSAMVRREKDIKITAQLLGKDQSVSKKRHMELIEAIEKSGKQEKGVLETLANLADAKRLLSRNRPRSKGCIMPCKVKDRRSRRYPDTRRQDRRLPSSNFPDKRQERRNPAPSLPDKNKNGDKKTGKASKLLKRIPIIGGLIAAGIAYATLKDREDLSDGQKAVKVGATTAGALGGAAAGASIGATVGSVVPVVGTAIGTVVGGILGGIAGSELGQWTGEAISRVMAGDMTSVIADIKAKTIALNQWITEVTGINLSESFTNFSESVGVFFEKTKVALSNVIDSIGNKANEINDYFKVLTGIDVKETAKKAKNKAMETARKAKDKAILVAGDIKDNAINGARRVNDVIKDETGIDLRQKATETAEKAKSIAINAKNKAGEIVSSASDSISEATGGVVDFKAAAEKTSNTVREAKESVTGFFGSISESIGDIKEKIKSVEGIEPRSFNENHQSMGDGKGNKAYASSKSTYKHSRSRNQRWENAKDDIVGAANAAGVDAGVLASIANFESSGFKANARPIAKKNPSMNKVTQFDGVKAISSAHGYGQFLDATWTESINKWGKKYGISNAGKLNKRQAAKYRNNTKIQAAMLAEFTKENVEIGKRIGGKDDIANVYALHNLGKGDGSRFLKAMKRNPNASVSSILSSKVIRGNKSLYSDGSITLSQAYKRMGKKMREGDKYAADARKYSKEIAKVRSESNSSQESIANEKTTNNKVREVKIAKMDTEATRTTSGDMSTKDESFYESQASGFVSAEVKPLRMTAEPINDTKISNNHQKSLGSGFLTDNSRSLSLSPKITLNEDRLAKKIAIEMAKVNRKTTDRERGDGISLSHWDDNLFASHIPTQFDDNELMLMSYGLR